MTTKKKILMIVQSTYPNDSRVRREAETLLNNRYEVHIICLKKEGQPEFEIIKEKIYVYRILKVENDEGVLKYIFFSFKFLIKSFLHAKILSGKKNFSLVQVHNLPDYLVFAALTFKLKKIPVILDLHDLTPELFLSKWQNKKRYLFWITKKIEYLACKFADHIITTSNGFKERLIQRGIPPGKITIVINNPSNFVKRTKPLNFRRIEKDLKLIYHGTIAFRFGLHLIIEVLPKIIEKIPGTVFHIYGDGDENYKNYLFDLAKKVGVEDNFYIYNSLLHEEIINIVQDYDLGVVPYLNEEFMQLALSTKSFEYAKLLIPMVASDLKPVRHYFDNESAIFFNPNNVNDLADKILYLVQEDGLMERTATNAIKKIAHIIDGQVERDYLRVIHRMSENK